MKLLALSSNIIVSLFFLLKTRHGKTKHEKQSKKNENRAKSKYNLQAGFTLVELLVVLAILSLLTGLVATQAINYLDSSRITSVKAQFANFETALDLYKLDVGRYPTEEQGLDILINPPEITSQTSNIRWNGPYLAGNSVPNDPWGNAYTYQITTNKYQLMSFGADGVEGGEGNEADITN